MKILSVSDYVEPFLYKDFDPDRFSGVDLVLACGDLPPEYLSHLSNALGAPLFFVRGNHDIRQNAYPPPGCEDLNARLIRFRGLNILGLAGSRWYNGGPFQYTERRMRKTIRGLWFKIRRSGSVDIVITHAPPRYIHDEEDPCHRGFKCFRGFIDKYAPAYFIHGHIHARFDDPSDRISRVGGTKVVNCCGHYLFDIENERILEKDTRRV